MRLTYAVKEMEETVLKLNGIVALRPNSAIEGLQLVAVAFAAILDVYSMPNAENPLGMCDDRRAFRKHFARLIETAPELRKKAAKKAGRK